MHVEEHHLRRLLVEQLHRLAAVARLRHHLQLGPAALQQRAKAFEQGAIDYLVKPVDEQRLADTVQRLQQQLARPVAAAPAALEAVLDGLSAELKRRAGNPAGHLQWIKASVGQSVRLIPVEQIAYLRADEKYTLVVWEGGEGLAAGAYRAHLSRRSEAPVKLCSAGGSPQADVGQLRRAFALA